ncbi:MAG: hypothetical protein ACLFMV_09650 [Spirochaetaceae bacterium]
MQISVSLIVLASNLQTSLLAIRAGTEGFAEGSLGLLMSAFFLGLGAQGAFLYAAAARD